MDIEKSINKGRIIYHENFWDKFWTLLLPIFVTFLILFNCLWVSQAIYDKPHKKYYWSLLLITASIFIFIVILIILYFKIDSLSIVEGKSRNRNNKCVREFAKKSNYKIDEKSNNVFIVIIKSKFLVYSHRYLTMIFDSNKIYYNCTTFDNGYKMINFKSPFYWFYNKKVERDFRIFFEKYSQ